jgi:hypothetical protein
MPLSFNIGGPCSPDRHYMLPPERRLADVLGERTPLRVRGASEALTARWTTRRVWR